MLSGLRSYLYPPDRLLVGEVRQEEALDLLIALNSGLPGMCSIHANSAREAIVKLCTLPLLAGENVGDAFAQPRQHAQGDGRAFSLRGPARGACATLRTRRVTACNVTRRGCR